MAITDAHAIIVLTRNHIIIHMLKLCQANLNTIKKDNLIFWLFPKYIATYVHIIHAYLISFLYVRRWNMKKNITD